MIANNALVHESKSGQIVRDRVGVSRRRRNLGSFTVPVSNDSVPFSHPPWYFVPGRSGTDMSVHHSRGDVERFKAELAKLDHCLEANWHPIKCVWQVWIRDSDVKTEWCAGWRRLFTSPMLDDRVMFRLHLMDMARWGGAKRSAARVESEFYREKDKREHNRKEEAAAYARDYWDHMRISTAGKGTKFTEHWS